MQMMHFHHVYEPVIGGGESTGIRRFNGRPLISDLLEVEPPHVAWKKERASCLPSMEAVGFVTSSTATTVVLISSSSAPEEELL